MSKWKVFILCMIVIGGAVGGYLWYFSESKIRSRAYKHKIVGEFSDSIDLLKDCIKRHNSNSAKLDLLDVYCVSNRYDELQIFLDVLVWPEPGTSEWRCLIDKMGHSYQALGRFSFEMEDWKNARSYYHQAVIHFDMYDKGWEFSDYEVKLSVILECLRDACAAAVNENRNDQLKLYSSRFINYYDEGKDHIKKDDHLHKYYSEIKEWVAMYCSYK